MKSSQQEAIASDAPPSTRLGTVHVDTLASPTRRQLVRVVLQGAALPAVGVAFGVVPAQALAADAVPARTASETAHVVRDFQDPYLELLRLLNVAAEIEHGLMVQYLYAGFSVKPAYQSLAGFGAPNTNDLIGIAVQEMQHLGKVNQLLVALGAAPALIREDFPYEPDLMPFRLRLEPLSRASLAKYVWTESPPGATDTRKARNADDFAFCSEIDHVLGKDKRPNFVGNLYDAVIALVREVGAGKDRTLPDLAAWVPMLEGIKNEGEIGHYGFFRQAFLGTHAGFDAKPGVWSRPVTDPLYPAYALPVDPTAYLGHANQIKDPVAQRLAWLGNLHYWIVLNLLSIGYSSGSQDIVAMSRGHMMGPFTSLARKLAAMSSGMPFDPLGPGYLRSAKSGGSLRFIRHLLAEADHLEKQITKDLPSDFAADFCRATSGMLARHEAVVRSARAPTQPWNDGLA